MALVVNDSLEKEMIKLLKPKKLSLISKIMKVLQSITRSILYLKTRNSALISYFLNIHSLLLMNF